MNDGHRGDCPSCKERDVHFSHRHGASVGCECSACGKVWAGPMLDEAREHTPAEAYR